MITETELINRFGYRRANAVSAPQHNAVRVQCLSFAQWLVAHIPEGRDQSLALTALQECMHWANSAIAMQNDVDTETPELPNGA